MTRFTPNEFKTLIAVLLKIHGKPIKFNIKNLNKMSFTGKLEMLMDSDTEDIILTDIPDEVNNENSK